MVVCKKELIRTKIIKKKEKKQMVRSKEIRFRWISARTRRLSFLFASWISPESETQCSRRRKHWKRSGEGRGDIMVGTGTRREIV